MVLVGKIFTCIGIASIAIWLTLMAIGLIKGDIISNSARLTFILIVAFGGFIINGIGGILLKSKEE